MKLTAEQKRKLTTYNQVRRACLAMVKRLKREQADLLVMMMRRWPEMVAKLALERKAGDV